MIPLAEINIIANKYQVSVETIEKDYAISWILFCLMRGKLKENFIFYGGTAIKRIYFEDHRFSEDIDLLSENKITLSELLQELNSLLLHAREKANLILTVNQNNIIATKNRIQLLVQYSGYEEIIGAPKEIRLDLTMNVQLFGKTNNKKIIASYSDSHFYDEAFSVLTLNTILANKIGLLMDITRNEPRDVFDIWFLLQRKDKFDFDFKEICKTHKEKYGFSPNYSTLRSCLQKLSLKYNWNERLRKQIALLPDIEIVLNDIDLEFKKLFLS